MNVTEQYEIVLKLAKEALLVSGTPKELKAVAKFSKRVHAMRRALDDLRARNAERKLRCQKQPGMGKVPVPFGADPFIVVGSKQWKAKYES